MNRLWTITLFLAILTPGAGQGQDADSINAALDNARRQIEKAKPELSRQQLDLDRSAILASRDKVYSLYAMRRWTPDQMSAGLASRWVELRTGRFAVPLQWSLDGIVVSRYGLCIEAALERITLDEFLAEGEKVVGVDSLLVWFPPAVKHRSAIANVARQQVADARARGLNAADAYSTVLAALDDLEFEPGDDLKVSWTMRAPKYTDGAVGWTDQIKIKDMSVSQFRAVPLNYWLLTIDSMPAHAAITVDGTQWGSAEKGSYVSQGSHTVVVEMSGYQRIERAFTVTNDPVKNTFTAMLTPAAARRKTK